VTPSSVNEGPAAQARRDFSELRFIQRVNPQT
jgi:hypothetical protein